MGEMSISEITRKWEERRKLFEQNIREKITYPDEQFFATKDSSMKKITSYIKKIKCFDGSNLSFLMDDASELNFTLYVSEIVSAVIELKFKISEIPSLLKLLSIFHRLYQDFSDTLLAQLRSRIVSNWADSDKNPEFRFSKICIRLYCELVFCGFSNDVDASLLPIINFWEGALLSDKEFNFCALFSQFVATFADDFNIYTVKQLRFFEENGLRPEGKIVMNKQTREFFIRVVTNYFGKLKNYYSVKHREFDNVEKKYKNTIGLRGDLTEEQRERQKKLTALDARLNGALLVLSEIIGVPLEEERSETPEAAAELEDSQPALDGKGQEVQSLTNDVWEDEDAKYFYENLRVFPNIPLYCPQKEQERSRKTKEEVKKKHSKPGCLSQIKGDEVDFIDVLEDNERQNKKKPRNGIMEAFISKLENCTNRDLVDQLAEEFLCFLNSKASRRSLVEALVNVKRSRLDLIPFYSRLIATLHPYAADVGNEVIAILKSEMRYQIRRKDQFNLELKVRTARFLGELVKFKLLSKADGIDIIRVLFKHFQNHFIDMLCHFLEVCGQYLFHSPETAVFMKNMLEEIGKKATLSFCDDRHSMMIQNSLYFCNPLKTQKKHRKELPPLFVYVKKLIFVDFNKTSGKSVLERLLTLPWSDKEFVHYAVKCLTTPWKMKYSYIPYLAQLVTCLGVYEPEVLLYIIDQVMEEIRLGMEANNPRHNQRRICIVKYLGELCNQHVVEVDHVFHVLYQLLTFGQSINGKIESDLPSNTIRIRLACELLNACSSILSGSGYRKNLDIFLLHLQSYIWHKKLTYFCTDERRFPPELDQQIIEVFDSLKIRKKLYNSPKAVYDAYNKIISHYGHQLADKLAVCHLGQFVELSSATDTEDPPTLTRRSTDAAGPSHGFTTQDVHMEGHDQDQDQDQDQYHDQENLEDPEFDRAYDKTILECSDSKGFATPKQSIEVHVPPHLRERCSKLQDQFEQNIRTGCNVPIKVLLLTKKNNKPQFRDIEIPRDDSMVITMVNRHIAKVEEQQEMKRLILGINTQNKNTSVADYFSPPASKHYNESDSSADDNEHPTCVVFDVKNTTLFTGVRKHGSSNYRRR